MAILQESDEDRNMMEEMRRGDDVPIPLAPTEVTQPPPASPPVEPRPNVSPAPTEVPQARALVPSFRLREERERREAIERERDELRARLNAPPAPPPPQRQAIPEPSQDPIGALDAMRQRIAEFEARDRQMAEDRRRVEEQQREIEQVASKVRSRVDEYAREHPEYGEQVQFLRQARAREMQRMGFNQQEVLNAIAAEELQLGRLALERDLDPGEMVAGMAQDRGWQPKADPKADEKVSRETSPPPEPRRSRTADELQMDRREQGQKIAKSPTGAGGLPAADMSLERLAQLDGAEFDKAWAAYARRLQGG